MRIVDGWDTNPRIVKLPKRIIIIIIKTRIPGRISKGSLKKSGYHSGKNPPKNPESIVKYSLLFDGEIIRKVARSNIVQTSWLTKQPVDDQQLIIYMELMPFIDGVKKHPKLLFITQSLHQL